MDKQIDIFREWRPIKGLEGLYDLRNDGLFYCHKRKQYTYGNLNGRGYYKKTMNKKTYRVHRLVYETFVGPIPDGYVVHHINHNGLDNRVENLELIDSYGHYLMHFKQKKNKFIHSKPVLQYTLDGELISEYPSISEASRITGFNAGKISICCNKKRKQYANYIWEYKEVA